ncbi:Glutamate-cysteine ligase catalytic subunit [Kalmanozyma brasiliensis GHG001]|uniref:Glutamate--cysteine ligase n=1 Tax=Kalmanozyma brasiliensis (strain GHG001) TaxID=1365824 RepID=V5EIT6_KALBG|nr:Glutamate-cysteine ligase catalytic subunit [Kalmanozyma brasiliensis GHG001]EST04595.1 Glutamate-cysteine ligase catalytic subunit [Kalmanozyma brasiliensis GHG001]
MGLLSLGTPLDWKDAQPLASHVRKHGIEQFLSLWNQIKDRRGDILLWGDEIEYIVVAFDEETQNAKLSLRQEEILKVLSASDQETRESAPGLAGQIPTFHPEFGRFMLESTPGSPYGASPKELRGVERNMRLRRQIARSHLKPNELPITLTSYPRLGVTDAPFTEPHYEANGNAFRSMFLPDELINPHARFPTLAANIRKRRGAKVAINMPIFKDVNTPSPFIDPSIPWDRELFPEDAEAKAGAAKPDHIYMDAMGFGMGCCCLQVTFQACSVQEARTVYDQLVPISPLLLALTAASPAYRGYLADVDCRWNVISAAVDDRTPQERGEPALPLPGHTARGGLDRDASPIPKSRYDSVDSYISQDPLNRRHYNDNPLPINPEVKQQLLDAGVDDLLSDHLAHLFIRDPIVIFSEMVDQDNETSTDHFENLQSTNWQTMRFKPPPPGGRIGWRVEFRSMEVQITDFENAAFSVFIVLLTRAILSFGLNFYMPLSKVDENMATAHRRDAVNGEKFWFRKEVYRTRNRHASRQASRQVSRASSVENLTNGASENGNGRSSPHSIASSSSEAEEEYAEFTMDELMNGKGDDFPGLVGLVHNYLDSLNIDVETRCEMGLYLDLVSQRASGKLMTTATWIRNYVRGHAEYKGDSVVSQKINYDMIKELDRIERGEVDAPGFLPKGYAMRRKSQETKPDLKA